MKRQVKVHRIGIHTAWIQVDGGNGQLVAVPINTVSHAHDPDGPRPGQVVEVKLPAWVEETADVL